MTARVRLDHVITRLELGGAQQNTLHCVATHDRERFDVGLLAGAGGMLDDRAREIQDARVDLVPWLVHPVSPIADLRAIPRLRRWFRARGTTVVHTHSSKAGILGRIAARLARVPVIVHTVHGWSFNDTQPVALRAAYTLLERIAARWTDRLIVVSSLNRDKGLARGIGDPDRYRTIHSGIHADDFRRPRGVRETVRASLGFGREDIVVGTVGNLKPQKGPLDLIAAAATVLAHDPRFRFMVIGDGPLRGQVEERVRTLGIGDRVRLLGWRDDVGDLLQAMDVFLLTSRFEGLPRSVLQAMAAGVPVVATAVDGTPEVVLDGETGLLVPPAEPEAAAHAVLRVGTDAALADRLREAASRLMTAEFDLDRMVRDLEAEYIDLARRAGLLP